jgi:hypothetical protein
VNHDSTQGPELASIRAHEGYDNLRLDGWRRIVPDEEATDSQISAKPFDDVIEPRGWNAYRGRRARKLGHGDEKPYLRSRAGNDIGRRRDASASHNGYSRTTGRNQKGLSVQRTHPPAAGRRIECVP